MSGTQQDTFAANDGDSGDEFGVSVAVSDDGTTVIIGAYDDEDPNGTGPVSGGAGSAYVFKQDGGTWAQTAKLAPDDGDGGDSFGSSVALSRTGNTAVIGAFMDEDPLGVDQYEIGRGAVYIYEYSENSWSQKDKIVPELGDNVENFGNSIALSNDGTTAIIGANRTYSMDNGETFVFSKTDGSWVQQARLFSELGGESGNYGTDVAVSADGSTALIGSPRANSTGRNSGVSLVYTATDDSWSYQTKLIGDDSGETDIFGSAVALSDDGSTAIIGAPGYDDASGHTGAAYIFNKTDESWTQQAKLISDEPVEHKRSFGWDVTMASDGTGAIIGTNADEKLVGSAYVFEKNNSAWSQQTKLAPEDGDTGDTFGEAVALSGDGTTSIVVSRNDAPNDVGSAYAFH